MNITQKLKKFVDEFVEFDINHIEKSYVSRYSSSGYYTIQDGNILSIGYDLPFDATTEDTEFSGRYALIINRDGENSWTPSVSSKILDKGVSDADAQSEALDLVEENKNNVRSVTVCLGINRKFANRPVFQSTSQYQHISKMDDYVVDLQKVYSSVDELPPAVKKLSSTKQRQWLHVWNSSYKEHKSEKRAFASAWSVVQKSQPDAGDMHVDKLEDSGKTCKKCGKPMTDCKCDIKKIALSIDLKKSSMVDGIVYGIVYEPNKKDTQGDWTSSMEIEHAAHAFLPSALRKTAAAWTDINHKDAIEENDVEIVESYIAPIDFVLPSEEQVHKGSWVVAARINSMELRKAIEDEEITGFSLEGQARRLDVELSV